MSGAMRVPLAVRGQEAVVGLLGRLPERFRAMLAGPEVVVDGVSLAPDARLLVRSQGRKRSALVMDDSPQLSRGAGAQRPRAAGRPAAVGRGGGIRTEAARC